MEYAILGGGASGLLTAYRLVQAGQQVILFEQEQLPGGLASGFQIGDIWLEKFYHHIFRTDKHIIKLIHELGLEQRLEWASPRTVSLIDGKIYQLDSPMTLLRFTPWSIRERIQAGAALATLKLAPPAWFENKTADPWLNKWMGKRAYEMVFQSLLLGKFGTLYDQIALPWFWARIHDRTTRLGYLRGGFQLIYNELAERIRKLEGNVHLNARVEKVEQINGRWKVSTAQGGWDVDRVISTLPTKVTCRLIPSLPAAYREQYDWGQAYGAHCLILAIDQSLSDSYWINICDRGYPFMALVEHTNMRAPKEYGGKHLLYLGNYRAMNDPLFTKNIDEIKAEFFPYLKQLFPAFDPSSIRESWVYSAPYAQPIVTTDYKEHIPPMETPLEGLWIANMFQIYPHDRGQNYSFALAETLSNRLLS